MRVLPGFAVLLLLTGACSRPQDRPASLAGGAEGWNVLLVSVDTVRADRLGAYGYEHPVRPNSPNIDEMMGRGVRFARATAPRAATWPSLGSVLTGLYPTGHGLILNGYSFGDDVETLPRILRAAGYQTGAFLSNMCEANHLGWDRLYCSDGIDGRVNRQAFRWMKEVDDSRPFLLWAHYFGAHPHYYNGGDGARELDPGYTGPVRADREALDRLVRDGIVPTEADRRHLDALYDAAIHGTDSYVSRLLEWLWKRQKLDRTIIVFLSDHGEELWQHHNYIFHVCSVYESTLHVPLAFVATGLIPEGGVVEQTVELSDVLPTLLELLGIEPPADLHGSSLVPYLARPGAGGAGKPSYSQYGDTLIHTVIQGDWKLIDNPDEHQPYCLEGAGPGHYPIERAELYNLTQDPSEQRNLASDHPERVAELQRLIERRFAGLSSRAREQELSPELIERLRALGYVAGPPPETGGVRP